MSVCDEINSFTVLYNHVIKSSCFQDRYIQFVLFKCKQVADLATTNLSFLSLLAEARTAQKVSNMSLSWLGLFLAPSEQFLSLLAEATSHIYNEVSLAKPSSQNVSDILCGQFYGRPFNYLGRT